MPEQVTSAASYKLCNAILLQGQKMTLDGPEILLYLDVFTSITTVWRASKERDNQNVLRTCVILR